MVGVHTPLSEEVSAGIIAFEVQGLAPEEVVKRLHGKHIVASKSPYAVSYPRLPPRS